jgi:hypothetical protein
MLRVRVDSVLAAILPRLEAMLVTRNNSES